MIIRKKYPSLDRPFMQTRFQGYGSGRNQNSGTTTNEDTTKIINEDRASSFPNPTAPAYEVELWTFFNQGGNRDSGNNIQYINENGDAQSIFVNNNGSSTAFLSTTQYPIATATGDPYELKRAAVGQDAIDATGYPFATQNDLDAAHAAGESVATVQADYDANGLGQG